mgnify:CR=1 FL=1
MPPGRRDVRRRRGGAGGLCRLLHPLHRPGCGQAGCREGLQLWQGIREADTWVLRMDKVPVWSTVNTGREIDYTYLLDAASASSLEAAGYSVQYNGYELGEGSEIGGTCFIPWI